MELYQSLQELSSQIFCFLVTDDLSAVLLMRGTH
jgi:hypothetical protein